jgi:hypothetical protein
MTNLYLTVFISLCPKLQRRNRLVITSILPIQSSQATIHYDLTQAHESVAADNQAEVLLRQRASIKGSQQASIHLQPFDSGIYYMVLQNGRDKETQKLFIN